MGRCDDTSTVHMHAYDMCVQLCMLSVCPPLPPLLPSSPPQMCGVLRALDTDSQRLREYIDQLLAKVLERNPGILEGMPRSQLTRGLQPDMLRGANIPEVCVPTL